MNDFYEVEALSFCTWKYTKFGHFLMWKSFSRAIFWKPLLPTTNQRMANGRSIFPLEKTVLISKIGQREPLFFSVWKFLVEVTLKNGAFWASEPWIKIRQSNIVETFALVQLFTIVVNFKSATCFTSHTFALQTKWILMACTDHQVVDVQELFSELTEFPIALQCVYDQA